MRSVRPWFLVLALVLLAVNLRTTVASLPPLLREVERDLGLSGPALGLLAALPVPCMAWFAPAAHRLTHRYGSEATALGAVLLVGAGNAVRAAGTGAAALYAGTLVAGIGVATAGVVLPRIVRESFPGRAGAVTGLYSVAMMLGAALAVSTAVPLERLLGSWRGSLAAWAVPALLAAVPWLALTARTRPRVPSAAAPTGAGRLPWRSSTAWLLAAFLALQASLAYAYLSWLAPAYQARGWHAGAAGLLVGVHNLAQLASALVLPALTDRRGNRRPALVGAVACTVAGAGWLLVLPDVQPWLASAVLGLGLGGGFSLTLVLLVDAGTDRASSARLAAMVFLVAYTAAAAAPAVVGALRDATSGFTAPFALLGVLALVQLALAPVVGAAAGPRPRSPADSRR